MAKKVKKARKQKQQKQLNVLGGDIDLSLKGSRKTDEIIFGSAAKYLKQALDVQANAGT